MRRFDLLQQILVTHVFDLRSKVVHPNDKTPLENKCGTIYHITCDNDPTHTYIRESERPLGVRFKEHLNLDKHCLATGRSVSKNNIRVLSRQQEWHRRKVKEAIYIKQQDPTMNRDQGYQLPPHLHPDPSAGIWSSQRHAWPRSVVTDRNVASFQANRSKVQ